MDLREAINNKNDLNSRHPWELARVEIVKKFIHNTIPNKDTTNFNLIDIGCGDMFVLETLNSHFNFNSVIGIDTALDPSEIILLNEKNKNTNISVYNDINQVSVNDNKNSIVLLLDVIEHIKNDNVFLSNLIKYNFVNDKTYFIITVPSFQSLYCKHDEYLLHYRRYNNLELVKQLQNHSYKIESNGYLFFSLLFPRLIEVLKEKIFNSKHSKNTTQTSLTQWTGNTFITKIIEAILLLDYYILCFLSKIKIKLPGLSNYVICKKPV